MLRYAARKARVKAVSQRGAVCSGRDPAAMYRRMPRRGSWAWIAVATVIAVATYCVSLRLEHGEGTPTYDVYAAFYPSMIYAVHALHDGGPGLFWHALQNCGQPFFVGDQVGLLYPANLLFLVLGPDAALRGIIFFNLLVAGLSTYLLCRELGAGPLAALGGALAFQLGSTSVRLMTWTPIVTGPYSWMPA